MDIENREIDRLARELAAATGSGGWGTQPP